jgi:capsular polysaccharide export protein
MESNRIGNVNGKHVLLLQGPMGSFFKRVDCVLRKKGAITYKVGLNAGDAFFSNRDNYSSFRGKRSEWKRFIIKFLKTNGIQQIYLFGDCRFYQAQSIQAAESLGIEVFVFEEGYVRPHYITFEKYGVNHYSHISRDRAFYDALELEDFPKVVPVNAKFSQFRMVTSAMFYYFVANVFSFRYSRYKHHRDFSVLKEAFYGIRNFVRKIKYKITEKNRLESITQSFTQSYFFVPLQTYNDFQILQHSGYLSIEKFIIEVLESFAGHAPKDVILLFKHHPVDRGRKDYSQFISDQAWLLGIQKRVHVVHDVYLPDCLANAQGTVTINSTVGLSSIYHKTPVITLGYALYDIEGLTNKGVALDDFWNHQQLPDMVLYEKFRGYLVYTTQLNGSFYGKMPNFE